MMTDDEKYSIVLSKYETFWNKQDAFFREANEDNPYPLVEIIRKVKIPPDDFKTICSKHDLSETQIVNTLKDLVIDKNTSLLDKITNLDDVKNKLKFKLITKIPISETIGIREFYNAIPSFRHTGQILHADFIDLYERGYIPHLYWNNGEPRFVRSMWFIIDFQIREAVRQRGFGISKTIYDYPPNRYSLKNYLNLILFMHNSWNLGVAILDYAEKISRQSGKKGKEFRLMRRSMQDSLWFNEGAVIAEEIISTCPLSSVRFPWLEYYRDIFACLSFESFPANSIIEFHHVKWQRAAAMIGYEFKLKQSTHNLDVGSINTYLDDKLSEDYSSLLASVDWALSMKEKRKPHTPWEVIEKYSHGRDKENNQIPCRICGQMFTPTRKTRDVTCGNPNCVIGNKNLSKRKHRNNFSLFG